MSGDVGLTEADERLRRHLRATTGGLGISDLDTVVREAEQRGAVQALRDAADEVYGDERASGRYWHPLSIQGWLRARADRLAGDQS